jgi:hypothetical protein
MEVSSVGRGRHRSGWRHTDGNDGIKNVRERRFPDISIVINMYTL